MGLMPWWLFQRTMHTHWHISQASRLLHTHGGRATVLWDSQNKKQTTPLYITPIIRDPTCHCSEIWNMIIKKITKCTFSWQKRFSKGTLMNSYSIYICTMSHVSNTLIAAGKCRVQWREFLPKPGTLAHRLPCTSWPAALGPEQNPRTWCTWGTSLLPDNAWCASQSLILQYGAWWHEF